MVCAQLLPMRKQLKGSYVTFVFKLLEAGDEDVRRFLLEARVS
jgi:hypothetical protein